MAVLGRGEGHGSITILHALGAGYGAAMGVDLSTRIQLRDTPVKNPPEDDHGLLPAVVESWKEAGLELPDADELHWAVRSDLPKGRGMKSSAALAVAAIQGLADATGTVLENHQIVDIAAAAQLNCGCSFTGSVDDAWAAVEPGWKVVDPSVPAAEGVLLQGEMEGDWTVLVIDRGPRELQPDPERFQMAAPQFQNAISSIEQGDLINTIINNGRAVSTALGDQAGRKLCNDLGILGCRGSSIGGSGPVILSLIPTEQESTIRRVKQTLEPRGMVVTETGIWKGDA